MNILLFGLPGSGKGTQGDNLVKEFNLYKVSTGELLREEIEKKTTLGIKIKSIIDKGSLVSDDITNNLIEKVVLSKKYFNRLIFDGYPRNLNQAKNLDLLLKKNNQRISLAISLNVNEKIIVKRILGRQVCSKCNGTFNKFFNPSTDINHNCGSKYLKIRSDDKEETIMNRIDTYLKETLPILEYYKNQKLLYEIDGMGKIHEIYEEIRGFIHSLDT